MNEKLTLPESPEQTPIFTISLLNPAQILSPITKSLKFCGASALQVANSITGNSIF